MNTPLRVGIVGLGTVGCATVNLLQQHGEVVAKRAGRAVEIAGVSARDKNKTRPIDASALNFVDDPIKLATSGNIDMVAELIGGSDGIARDLVETALKHGKPVVTANKALIASHGLQLAEISESHSAPLAFEAAVAGGIPIIKTIKESLAGNVCSSVRGILNGTCNYILSEMKLSGRDFDEVLVEAQDKGYAEADPTFDVDGIDTAHKLVILASLAFGITPQMNAFEAEGIRSITTTDLNYADELGYAIKLLGCASHEDGQIHMGVYPCLVAHGSPLAGVADVLNAVSVDGDKVNNVFLQGPGAGGDATASAVVGDIIDIARDIHSFPFGVPAKQLKAEKITPAPQVMSYYLRTEVTDEPGVLAEVTRILHDHEISVDVMIQPRHQPNAPAPLVLTTHPANEDAIKLASGALNNLPAVVQPPQLIRIVS